MTRLRLFSPVHNGTLPRATSLRIAAWFRELTDCEVEIAIKRLPVASDQQRRYWFGVIIPAVMAHSGYEQHEKDAAHADLLFHLMPELRRERVNRIDGIQETVRVSWTDLTKTEATELIERAFRFAAVNLGLIIPSPQEYE